MTDGQRQTDTNRDRQTDRQRQIETGIVRATQTERDSTREFV